MEITTNLENGVSVVRLAGRFDAQTAGMVDEGLQKAIADGGGHLVLDMSKVEYISSAGLRVLLSTAKRLTSSAGELVLCGLQPYVLEVFDVAGFTSIFQIKPDAAAALNSF